MSTIEFIRENTIILLPRLLSQYDYEFIRFIDLCDDYGLSTKLNEYIGDMKLYKFNKLNYIIDYIVDCDIENYFYGTEYNINDFDNLDYIDKNNIIKSMLCGIQCNHYSIIKDETVDKYLEKYGLNDITVIKEFYTDFLIHLLKHLSHQVNKFLDDNFVYNSLYLTLDETIELSDIWDEISEDLISQINRITQDIFQTMKNDKF